MAESKSRPVPKRRSVHLGSNRDGFSTTDLYGSGQDLQTESCPGQCGLPSCVQQKNSDVTADQKNRDSTLPRLLYELDEACKKDSNDVEKSNLANACLKAASSPNRKYRILKFFELLENNKNDIVTLPGALSILEKYAINLLRDEKPPQWKEIKFSTSIIQNMVYPVNGAIDVLKQMGYTQETRIALTFPPEVDQPNNQTIIVLTADLSIARHETDTLMNNRHPFLVFNPSGFGSMSGGSMPDASIQRGGFCGVCSEQNLAKNCVECDMQFCLECDERWHCHKLRRNHVRTSLLAAKDNAADERRRRPVPVPRQRKSQKDPSNYVAFQHYNPSGNQEIKRPPSQTGTSRDNVTSHMTSPGNVNIHVNPSQQQQRSNAMHGAYAVTPLTGHNQGSTHQNMYQSENRAQDFNQSGNSPHGFNQSGNSPQGFNQSGESVQKQTGHKLLQRLLSCPNCSLLYDASQGQCPSCDPSKEKPFEFSPTQQQQRFNLDSAATKLPNFPSDISNQQTLLKEMAKAQELVTRTLPDPPRGPGLATRVSQVDDSVYEDMDALLEWTCEHCTFANPLTTKVCEACFRTPSDLKKFPNLVQKSAPSPAKPMASSSLPATGACGTQAGAVHMTPKTRPLEGGIFISPKAGDTPPLPAKKQYDNSYSPGEKILDAQKQREQQLSEKEKGKLFDAEKRELLAKGLITEDEMYTIDSPEELNRLVEATLKRMGNLDPSQGYPRSGHPGEAGYSGQAGYPGQAGYSGQAGYPGQAGHPGQAGYSGQAGYPEANPGADLNQQQLMQLLESGVITEQDVINSEKAQRNIDVNRQPQHADPVYDVPRRNEALLGNKEDISLSEEQLQQLLKGGGFFDTSPPPQQFNQFDPGSRQPFNHANLGNQPPQQFAQTRPGFGQPRPFTHASPGHQQPQQLTQPNQGSRLTQEELDQLYQAGVISLGYNPPLGQLYNVPKRDDTVNQADIQQMFAEYKTLQTNERPPEQRQDFNKYNNSTYQYFNVTREAPVLHDIYDKLPSTMYASMPAQGSKDNFSSYLNSKKPLENVTRGNFIDDQSRLYVEWVKQAEQLGFAAEELNLANHLNWQDPEGRNPVQWLKDEWSDRVAEVIGRVTQQTSSENDRIGNLSTDEAKQGLLENHGSVESACKACIESRREKLAKMGESSFFGRVDCLNALDRNDGNLEQALLELEVKALEPIRKRVLPVHDLEDSGARRTRGLGQTYKEIVNNKNVSFERRVRIVFAEQKMQSWGRADTTVRLVDMGFNLEDCIEAADAYGDMERSLGYLQQNCPICVEDKPMGQMITFLSCQDKICKVCVSEYLEIRIKEMQIHQIVCPVCGLPDLRDEVAAALYFNNLDILMRGLVEPETHDLFQKKLRDRALRKEPNFRWCAHCSCGFINDFPNINKMQCPDCQRFTCFSCKKPWEDQHQGISCEQFAQWKAENDEDYQIAGLAGHLARNGIDCPECKFRYDLARGGCMHFKCGQCGHEFCSGCYNPFKHGEDCGVSPDCARKGIHAHHPRDCLSYLRDWEPHILQELLQENGVDYKAGARGLPVQDDEENPGAVGGGQKCKVMLQREQGMEDVECGIVCQPDHDGLCKKHYMEYLVDLINKNGIDPADKMTIDEMHIVFHRSEIQAPARVVPEDDDDYRARLLGILKQQIPLPRPPGLQAAVVEVQGEEE